VGEGGAPLSLQEVEELQGEVDKLLQPLLDWTDKWLKAANRCLKLLEELENSFKYRFDDEVRLGDLHVITNSLILIQLQLAQVMELLYGTISLLKMTFASASLASLVLVQELFKAPSEVILSSVRRLNAVEEELGRLRRKIEERATVPDTVEKVLEDLVKRIEEAKEAQKRYMRYIR